jgi:fatty acid desaturase
MIHFIRTQYAPKNNPAKPKDGKKKISLQQILYAVIAVTSIVFGFWHLILLYWFVPLITWFSFIFRLREIGEHSAFEIGEDLVEKSRTVTAPALEQLFLAPANISYHNEHHLFPNVPYYNLKRLHKRLMKNPDYKARGRVCKSYWGVIRECWQFTGRKIYEKQEESMPNKAVA